jgi:hypothetical protein
MRIFTVLGILFYATVINLIGLTFIIFSLNVVQPQNIVNLIAYTQSSPQSKIVIGFCGALLILISFSFAQLILGRLQREKTIAFTTSNGEVTISLSAVEDLVRRLAGVIPEIKELRPDVIATKKGILVDLRVILRSEANIPDLTARLQDMTRAKIQEVLGIEEEIIIKIHVAKIISKDERERRSKNPDRPESVVPFSGYGRT